MSDVVGVMPCLDIQGGRVVKGIHFTDLIDAGDPVESAVTYERAGADELAFLDISATIEQRRTVFDVLERVTAAVRMPVTVGGGIRSVGDVEEALAAGAAKVSVSSAAFRNPEFIREAASRFGGERIVLAIDADLNASLPSRREVFIDGGRTPTGVDAIEFARQMAGLGAGAFLPTSKLGDGARRGYDLELIRGIVDATGLPTVASGGAGKLVHFLEAVREGGASAGLDGYFGFGGFGDVFSDRTEIGRSALREAAERGVVLEGRKLWLVGDTPNDVSAGRALGIPVVGVASGKYGAEELMSAGAARVVRDFTEGEALLEWMAEGGGEGGR